MIQRTLRLLALSAAVGLVWLTAPAGAIETASFGLNPAGEPGRTALHEEVKPGQRVEDAVRLWNKTDAPVVVRLQVQGAAIDQGGQVSLGGTGGAAGWISLGSERVTLPPKGAVDVPVVLRAPRNMPAGQSTAAIVAEAVPEGGSSNVAVVQRVALMVYAKAPAGSPLKAALGWIAWVAVALLAVVGGAVLKMRRRRGGSVAPAAGAGAADRAGFRHVRVVPPADALVVASGDVDR